MFLCRFRFVALVISIILTYFTCGCPLLVPGDKAHDLGMADRFLWAYQKEDDRRILIGATPEDVVGIINSLAVSLGYKEEKTYHQATYSLFLQKKIIESADTMLIFDLPEQPDNNHIDHIFLLKPKKSYTNVSVFRHGFFRDRLLNSQDSMYHYDWISAIESECRARGISTIVKQ